MLSLMNRLVVQGDCLEVMCGMGEASVSAVVTDPPYELNFMGKGWDNAGVAFSPATWREVLRVLKPGGHLLAFGGARTFHRVAVAIEDAGFEIRDCIMWLYGSGMPKSHNLKDDWQGWGTTLKPSYEPIIVARKPLSGTVLTNVLAHGTGAMHIDACRIPTNGETIHVPQSDPSMREGVVGTDLGITRAGKDRFQEAQRASVERANTLGRWPANVAFDEEAAGVLDARTSQLKKAGDLKGTEPSTQFSGPVYGDSGHRGEWQAYGDSGGASRFFYVAKAAKKERNAGLDEFPDAGRTDDGYGTIQQPKLDRAAPRENWTPHPVKNNHPTVKPVKLMRWLVRLITPPDGLVLDPFCGSGTTGIAAVMEGFPFMGIEQDESYCAIARARIEHAASEAVQKEAA